MFLSLPIPSGKYEINIKYFGYKINDYAEFIIPITENTTVLNIIEIIKKRLSNKKVNNIIINNVNNPHKKRYRNKKSKNNNFKNQEITLSEDSIEIVLLTKSKQIYQIFTTNDYIFTYLKKGYELVAYEKNNKKENIYFYLTKYYYSYIFFCPWSIKLFQLNWRLNSFLQYLLYFLYIYSSFCSFFSEDYFSTGSCWCQCSIISF